MKTPFRSLLFIVVFLVCEQGQAAGGFLLIVSGPSGAGKSELIRRLQAQPDLPLAFSVSATTRQPRPGEISGREYEFLTVPQFQERIQQNGFAEWAQVHGNYYGTPIQALNDSMAAGKIVVLNVDVQGFQKLRQGVRTAKTFSVFIDVPNSELRNRLVARGKDSPEAIDRRCANALSEVPFAPLYDLRLDNRDGQLDAAAEKLAAAVRHRHLSAF